MAPRLVPQLVSWSGVKTASRLWGLVSVPESGFWSSEPRLVLRWERSLAKELSGCLSGCLLRFRRRHRPVCRYHRAAGNCP